MSRTSGEDSRPTQPAVPFEVVPLATGGVHGDTVDPQTRLHHRRLRTEWLHGADRRSSRDRRGRARGRPCARCFGYELHDAQTRPVTSPPSHTVRIQQHRERPSGRHDRPRQSLSAGRTISGFRQRQHGAQGSELASGVLCHCRSRFDRARAGRRSPADGVRPCDVGGKRRERAGMCRNVHQQLRSARIPAATVVRRAGPHAVGFRNCARGDRLQGRHRHGHRDDLAGSSVHVPGGVWHERRESTWHRDRSIRGAWLHACPIFCGDRCRIPDCSTRRGLVACKPASRCGPKPSACSTIRVRAASCGTFTTIGSTY